MTSREQILYLIENKPKHFSAIIQRNKELVSWVKENTLVTSDRFAEILYSALYQETNICKNGNKKTFGRFKDGFNFCGHQSKCVCSKQSTSQNVSITKLSIDHTEINKKRVKTMISKFGVAYNSQRADIHQIWKQPKIHQEAWDKLNDFDWLDNEYNDKKRSLTDISLELQVYYGTVGFYCNRHGFDIRRTSNYSKEELELGNWIESLGIEIERSNWDIISPKEIDIFIPSRNLAIEMNGLRWHSFHPDHLKVENRYYHLDKSIGCSEKGMNLLHFTDWQWHHKKEIVQNIIKSKLGFNTKIGARKCQILPVKKQIAAKFLNQYHIQGTVGCHSAYGIYYQNRLISVMTIGFSRFDKKFDWEMLRFCTLPDITIVGGLSKLTAHIMKNHDGRIISYCDLMRSNGNSYRQSGWKEIRKSDPGYFWTDGNNVIPRYRAQKHRLGSWIKTFDPKLSESKNMFAAGYRRFWDCGNLVFEI